MRRNCSQRQLAAAAAPAQPGVKNLIADLTCVPESGPTSQITAAPSRGRIAAARATVTAVLAWSPCANDEHQGERNRQRPVATPEFCCETRASIP